MLMINAHTSMYEYNMKTYCIAHAQNELVIRYDLGGRNVHLFSCWYLFAFWFWWTNGHHHQHHHLSKWMNKQKSYQFARMKTTKTKFIYMYYTWTENKMRTESADVVFLISYGHQQIEKCSFYHKHNWPFFFILRQMNLIREQRPLVK